jgi:hypothetical protein
MSEENVLPFKDGFITRIQGLVNGEGKKVLLVKEQYLIDQFTRFGHEFFLETQCFVIKVNEFDDIKELDEKMMEECGWIGAEKKSKIVLLE